MNIISQGAVIGHRSIPRTTLPFWTYPIRSDLLPLPVLIIEDLEIRNTAKRLQVSNKFRVPLTQ
jgi:hypothetical protein